MTEVIQSEEVLEDVKENFPRTKATIAILLAIAGTLRILGFDVAPILQARESLAIAKVEAEKKKLEFEIKKMEMEIYNSNTCSFDKEFYERLQRLEEKSHSPAKP